MFGHLLKERPIQTQRLLALAELSGQSGLRGPIGAVVRLLLKQNRQLLSCQPVLVPLHQHLEVVEPCGRVAGLQGEHALEQHFGIIEHVELQADLCQQAHALDVVPMHAQVLAHPLFGRLDLPIRKHAACCHDVRGQRCQLGDVRRRVRRIRAAPAHPVERRECPPARRQRRVQMHRTFERVDGRGSLSLQDMAMSSLLVQPRILRVMYLE